MTYRCDLCDKVFEVLMVERHVNPNDDGFDMCYDVSPCCRSGFVEL